MADASLEQKAAPTRWQRLKHELRDYGPAELAGSIANALPYLPRITESLARSLGRNEFADTAGSVADMLEHPLVKSYISTALGAFAYGATLNAWRQYKKEQLGEDSSTRETCAGVVAEMIPAVAEDSLVRPLALGIAEGAIGSEGSLDTTASFLAGKIAADAVWYGTSATVKRHYNTEIEKIPLEKRTPLRCIWAAYTSTVKSVTGCVEISAPQAGAPRARP